MTETDQLVTAQNDAPATDAPVADAAADAAAPATDAVPDANTTKTAEPVKVDPDYVDELIAKAIATDNKKKIAIGVTFTVGLLYTWWTYAQFSRGYSSNDPANAFYIEGVDRPGLTKDAVTALATEANVTVKAGYPVDMGHLFRSWFKWGFWGSFLNIVLMAAFFPLRKFCPGQRSMMKMAYMGSYAALALNAVIWFILGFFWRYSRAGRIAAGDKITDRSTVNMNAQSLADGYQLKSGSMMSSFFWTILIVLFLGIAAISGFFVMQCLKGDPDKIDKAGEASKAPEATKTEEPVAAAEADAAKGDEENTAAAE